MPNRTQPTSASPFLTLAAGAVLGVAGTYLFRAAKEKVDALPAGATAKDALKAVNPVPTLVSSAKAAKDAVQDAATAAKDRFNKAN